MKKTICILCALTVLAALCGTASCEQTGPDLYHIGLEVTGLMGEIAGNEAYLSAFGRPETWTEVREAADTGDYDQPTAVYSVRLEDAEGYVREMFAAEPKVVAIHAGLECGLLAEKLPGLDCVSFGPDITDIHTPSERLHIASTQRTWEFVKAILKDMKQAE